MKLQECLEIIEIKYKFPSSFDILWHLVKRILHLRIYKRKECNDITKYIRIKNKPIQLAK